MPWCSLEGQGERVKEVLGGGGGQGEDEKGT